MVSISRQNRMDQILRLNEFFVEGGKQNLSHVLLHISEPSNPEEAKKGYFFALSETNNASISFISKFQDIIERAQTEYYEIPNDSERDPFELVLEKMNGESFVLDHEQGELNSIVGAIREKEIIFSFHGKPHLLLFYRNKAGAYEKMDLIRNNGEDTSEEEQMFSQVIQGKLTPNDYLFAGTPHIVDFFSHDRLEKIITTRSAEESSQHIEKVLKELNNGFSFGGLIIHLFKQEQPEIIKKIRPASDTSSQSLQKLFTREQSTAETLSPSLLPNFDKIRGILNSDQKPPVTIQKPRSEVSNEIKSNHLNRVRTTKRNEGTDYLAIATSVFKGLWKGIKLVGSLVLQLLYIIYTFFYSIFKTFVLLIMAAINYKNRRTTILENWRMGWRGRKESFKHLPFLTKLMLFGSIALAFGFIFSIFYIQHQQKVAAEELTFSNSIRDLRAKKESVESAIIYKNDELAYSEFRSASDNIASLNCKTLEQKNICNSLRNEIENLGIKLRKITNLNTAVLTSFSGFPNTGSEGLVKAKNKLIAFSPATSTLFVYDLLSGESKLLPTYPTIGGFSEAATPKENDYVLFLFNKNQLMRLDLEDLSIKLVEISFSGANTELSGFVVYNRRLYALDSKNGTILRHDSIKTGFGQGTDWLKQKTTTLLNGGSLTIDGDVFVAKPDGTIAKFTSGTTQPFDMIGIEPNIKSISSIWTYTDIPYIYILERDQKRIVVLEKNGHFVNQLTNEALSKPSGFAIDYQAKQLFLLDSGRLLKSTLP